MFEFILTSLAIMGLLGISGFYVLGGLVWLSQVVGLLVVLLSTDNLKKPVMA